MNLEILAQPSVHDSQSGVVHLMENGWVETAVKLVGARYDVAPCDRADMQQDLAERMMRRPEFATPTGYVSGYRILGQIATDRCRRERTQRQDPVAKCKLNDPDALPYLPPVEPVQGDFSSRVDTCIIVQDLLLGLDNIYRETVEFFYFKDQDIPRTAIALGIPEGTVKSRLTNARRMLHRQLAEMGINSYRDLL